jgi:tRNA A37 threonylcarbamoyladenosine biosynthesis protein TsaE
MYCHMDRYNIHEVTSNKLKNAIDDKMCLEWAGGTIKQIQNSDNKNAIWF